MASELKVNVIVNASGDNDSGIDLATNDQVLIKTADTTAVTVDSSQNTTFAGNLTVSGAFTSQGIDDNADATAITIDSSENVGIGTSSPSFESGTGGGLEINNSSGNGSHVKLTDSASGSGGTNGFDLYAFNTNGYIENYEAGSIVFRNNGSECMRIDSSGQVLINKTATGVANNGVLLSNGGSNFARDSNTVLDINRNGSDGTIIALYGQGNFEGSISVSGSTVSYNGGHLARWSRLLDNSKDTTIVKGTVMTNLDEMVEWDDEDNEQLNKMAVSSVEGDANVAGVFVNWDDDDDWNDMNVAMTGDMVIRIAQGTTVARGDLLMSAGDGTAKPQGDDIVKSKTIAKVTSTNVSHTYDDGSYLVPCVLMAC